MARPTYSPVAVLLHADERAQSGAAGAYSFPGANGGSRALKSKRGGLPSGQFYPRGEHPYSRHFRIDKHEAFYF